ncbi:MAG TPA: beta-ketoacyl synthase N-terminal-like domain-containing protein, partial [Anaerolineales bacterium]|nr:beta-ketoacyl synthase N-terminal-like domain-containing protein [Anaerolineales bacterium]
MGLTAKESWDNCTNAVSGVGPITLFEASDFLVQIACEVKDFDAKRYMTPAEARRRDRCQQLAATAAAEAMRHSGLQVTEQNAHRVGVIISSAIGGIRTLENTVRVIEKNGPRRASPFT